PPRCEGVRRFSSSPPADPSGAPLFESASLRFSIRWRDQDPLPGFRRFGGDALRDWDKTLAAEPDARLLTRWREAPSALGALAALPSLAAGEAVLESARAG